MNHSGKPEGATFKGDLADISAGGASIFIYRSNKDMARQLLGRRLNIQVSLSSKHIMVEIDRVGLVIAVSDHLFNDYSIHLKFDTPLSDAEIENIHSVVSDDSDSSETEAWL